MVWADHSSRSTLLSKTSQSNVMWWLSFIFHVYQFGLSAPTYYGGKDVSNDLRRDIINPRTVLVNEKMPRRPLSRGVRKYGAALSAGSTNHLIMSTQKSWLRGSSRYSVQFDPKRPSGFFRFYRSEVVTKMGPVFRGNQPISKRSISELGPWVLSETRTFCAYRQVLWTLCHFEWELLLPGFSLCRF